jgi:RHS repeat-associated protein
MYQTSDVAQTSQSNAVYDAAGQRVATQVDGIWTFFIYDVFGKLVAEYGGVPPADGGGVKYVISDWQGSTRAVVNNSGFVVSRMDYTAYGDDIGAGTGMRAAAQGFGSTNKPRQRYGLTERDEATGLDHTPWRKHENRAGRWTSPDPYKGSMSLGDPQSFNRYAYVGNDPVNLVDPSGLDDIIRIHVRGLPWPGGGGGGGGGRTDPETGIIDDPRTKCYGPTCGGGGAAPQPPTPDPCEGKKGNLDHYAGGNTGIPHISPRHISQSPEFAPGGIDEKSYYTFGTFFTNGAASRTTSQREQIVMNLNQEAFMYGGAIRQGNRTAYVYAPFVSATAGANGVEGFVVGQDKSRNYYFTNVRTVVVGGDCRTVITSFPGLPGGLTPGDPRISGTATWWKPGITIPFL